MRKSRFCFFTLMLFPFTLPAQTFITLGGGANLMRFSSSKMQHFADSYNALNGDALFSPLRGISDGQGLHWSAGLRHMGKVAWAIHFGRQAYRGKDIANFQNGDTRILELTSRSWSVEGELGHAWETVYLSAATALHLRRKTEIKSASIVSEAVRNPLNGRFRDEASRALEIGVGAGVHHEPIFLTVKIMYPVYTGGKNNPLRDLDPDKIASGLEKFPDDFFAYFNGEAYEGVPGNINGIKVLLTLGIAIQLK